MLSRTEIEHRIPQTDARYDVIVAGGGPAGIGAALAAAMQGASTLLLEGRSFLGGVAALGLWMPINRIFLDGGSRGGVHELITEKLREHGQDAAREGKRSWVDGDNLSVHPEYLKLALFELLEERGVHYRLHSPVVDVLKEGNAVKGVTVHTKKGRQLFHAEVTIDATGDGDLAYLAGADMVAGRETDGAFMPVTLLFSLACVDEERLLAHLGEVQPIVKQAAEEGYLTAGWYSFNRTTVPDTVGVNHGGWKDIGLIDGSDPQHLTLAERAGTQLAHDFVRIARSYRIPGLEECHLMTTSPCIAVRETRRIVGDYVITVEDVCAGVEFEDVVARRYGAIDPGGLGTTEELKKGMKSGHAYPYRALLPVGIEQLLVAGRCASATHLGQAAGKSMGNMIDLGQAAGVAAALSCRQRISPRRVEASAIREVERQMGVAHFAQNRT